MKRRQTNLPRQWLVADGRLGEHLWRALRSLPRGSGVLVLYRNLPKRERARLMAKLRMVARTRGLVIIDEGARKAARVHDLRELRKAGLRRTPLLFLSPLFPTRSHPDWRPMSRIKAAALLRHSTVPVVALGGMDSKRFSRIRRLGFQGWAGIDAWIRI
jgi:thiamine-phosphate pyrophosphorylase